MKYIFLLIIFSTQLTAQVSEFDSLVNKGIYDIYNIKFIEAEKTFLELDNKYPKHPAGKFFNAMIIWWKIMLDQNDEQYDELFEKKLEGVIDFCDDLLDENDENVDAIFFKGGSLGFRGRLYSIRKEWFDAALDGKDALPLVYEAYEIDPKNEDVKLGFGIYNYYAEAIPEKYPFIKPAMIFFPSGDKKKGIEQLTAAAEKSKYAKIESQFFLMTLYYQFENDYNKALVYAEQLHNQFPDNPIFQKYVGRIFVKKGNYENASVIFSDIKNKCDSSLPGYNNMLLRESTYYLGVNYMQKNKIDLAEKSFAKCYELSQKLDEDKEEESGFMVNAILYLGRISNQTGEKEKAKKYFNQVLEIRDYNNSHNKAKNYISKLK
ncbi:MAG: tetratricopeptide repeat protein [Ignavibacteriales bacterium]|nr:tetratricopeptide repeat protein [Ignavibacteriales bacterium]